MAKRVVVLDSSILCCYFEVPGKESAGSGAGAWTYSRVNDLLTQEIAKGSTLVLPLAALIEVGNHIANASSRRYECAQTLASALIRAVDALSPWATFTEQSELWGVESIRALADSWPEMAARRLSLADATIKDVADYYARAGYQVELLTGDQGLTAYHTQNPAIRSRRSVRLIK